MNSPLKPYTLLMASLPPYSADLFSSRYPPVSQFQLRQRLKWLDAEDLSDLTKIQNILYWSEVEEVDDLAFVEHAQRLLQTIRSDFLRQLISWRLEIRTILAALRKRLKQPDFIPDKGALALSQWNWKIIQNWHLNDFALSVHFPWIGDVNQLLINGQSLELERFLLNTVWQYYERQSQGHYFDFEAVIIYVLRWDVVYRWNQYDSSKARGRFVELLNNHVHEGAA